MQEKNTNKKSFGQNDYIKDLIYDIVFKYTSRKHPNLILEDLDEKLDDLSEESLVNLYQELEKIEKNENKDKKIGSLEILWSFLKED